MILFQSQIEEHQKLAEHYRELAAKREALAAELTSFQQQAGSDLSSLKLLVDKCKEVAPGAISSLKSAVLGLFDSGDGGSDEGNQPTDPTPDTDPCSETKEATTDTLFTPGLTIVDGNGSFGIVTGGNNLGMKVDWLGIGNCPNPASGKGIWYNWAKDERAIADFEKSTHDRVKLLTTEELLQFLNWDKEQLDDHWGGEWFEVGTVGCSIRWGGATINRWIVVLTSCEWAFPFASHLACLLWGDAPLTGQHCTIAPIDNENKGTEEGEAMPQPSSTEMVHTSARTGYLKLKESGQILVAYVWFPRKDLASAWFDWLDGMSLGSPELRLSQRNSSWKYEIKLTGLSMTQIERLSQEDLSRKPSKKKETPAQAAGIEPPSGWRQPQPSENSFQLFVKVLLPECEYVGQVLPVSRVSDNEIGYTVTLPNGEKRWYPCDMVQIEENALPTEPTQSEAIEFEFGDIVEVIADLNGTHLIGSFGKVKFVKDNRIALEIDEQLAYFQPEELKLRSKAEEPREQQQLQTGQVLLNNRVVTTGAYIGSARRTAIANARRGTANKIAALELVKAGLSPEAAMAAATGTDDASDF